MTIAVIFATLIAVPLLGLVTFVQLLYLESLRLRTRDLASLRFFKSTLEDRLGMKTDDGAGTFSLVKHTLLVLLGVTFFAWYTDGTPWSWGAELRRGRAPLGAEHIPRGTRPDRWPAGAPGAGSPAPERSGCATS